MQRKIQAARKNLEDLDRRAVATQAKNEELLKQYQARQTQIEAATRKLDVAVGQAAPLLAQSAAQANSATKQLGQVADRLTVASNAVLDTHVPAGAAGQATFV
jgi:hypothetical protein